MKIKLLSLALFALAASAACGAGDQQRAVKQVNAPPKVEQVNAPPKVEAAHAQKKPADDHGHDHGEPGRVPAFESNPKNLPATLAPEAFTGKTRLAYKAVREIPETIAQLPCYCHCDRGFGHKSLHSCYVDGHASSCAVCVEEVLTAYRLQKEEGLSPAQIRERIIAEYSKL